MTFPAEVQQVAIKSGAMFVQTFLPPPDMEMRISVGSTSPRLAP
jgi:hypothetical protein